MRLMIPLPLITRINIWLAVFLFLGSKSLCGQTALRVIADTVKVMKAELQVQNATKDTLGFLFNEGGGKTAFRKIHLKNLGDSAITIPGQDTLSIRFYGASYAASVPDISLAVKAGGNDSIQLKWWQSDQELYQSPKIGVIGDSQGHGSYASTFANSIVGRLQTYINAVATNTRVINYCIDGYNSRKLAPNGSNAYVDTLNNVTKAIADGNNIIILINTSNDYASTGAGGEMTTEEALSNTLLIEEACKKAGVQLLVLSSFPRNQLGASQRLKLRESADNLRKTFGQRCAYVYHLIEDPLNPDFLLSSLQVGDNIHLNDQGCQIVFNALRNTLASYFTANTEVVKYIVQRSGSMNGTFTDFQTINRPSGTSLTMAPDGYFYRVRIYFRDGYFSNWSNVVRSTIDDSTPVNELPFINVGGPVTITLPLDSVNLSATATAPNGGSITTYAWTKIIGGAATITQPTHSTTTVKDLVQGNYIFRCTVTDNKGNSNSADKTVEVHAALDSTGATKFNFNLTPQNIPGWIDVSDGPLAAVNNGKSWLDNATGVSLTCLSNSNTIWGPFYSHSNADNDNGEVNSDAGGFATDPLVISSAWYSKNVNYTSSASNQLKISGLNPAKKYILNFYCSLDDRFGLNASPTVIVLNNNLVNQRLVQATGNTSSFGEFKGIKPNGNGEIPVFIGSAAGQSEYGMINGLVITEDTTANSNPPEVSTGPNQNISLPGNSTVIKATITNSDNEPVSAAWTKISGPSATIVTPSSLTTSVTGLSVGTYVFRCTVTDNNNLSGTADITVTVNLVNNNPTLKVAFSKFSFTETGWNVLTGEPYKNAMTLTTPFEGNTINISTANWSPFAGQFSADSTGESIDDGGGFSAPPRVIKGNLFNLNTFNTNSPQVQITNLAQGTYSITLFGSISTATANALTADCNTQYKVNNETTITVDNRANTSKTAVFNNIIVSQNGTINIFLNPITGGSNHYIASLSYFILEKTD
jgi:hypothetical protein